MSLRARIFPAVSRGFPGMRWVNIGLRTLHLVGVAGIGGANLYPGESTAASPYLWLSLFSGVGLMGVFLYSNGIWLLQLRGQLILLKLLLLGIMRWWPGGTLELCIMVIVISSVIAHAPANMRYYSPWHRRRLECLSTEQTPVSSATNNPVIVHLFLAFFGCCYNGLSFVIEAALCPLAQNH